MKRLQYSFMDQSLENLSRTFTSSIEEVSIIAIGNPIVDITAKIDSDDTIHNLGLEWGKTIFANENNVHFFKELEMRPEVTYTPGGSIQNTLRVASWCLSNDPKYKGKIKLTMLGCVGNDLYKGKIINSFNESGVSFILETVPNMQTSRCGIGVKKNKRCLLTEIRASKCLSEEFVEKHKDEIYSHNALLLEGYFLQEKFHICKSLCDEFNKEKKLVILTLGAAFMVQFFNDKIIEIANKADLIIGNMGEAEIFAGGRGADFRETFANVHKKLSPKDRTLVVTCGQCGVFCSKYNYKRAQLEFVLQCFPTPIENEEILDHNGAGDAFLGGFLTNYLRKKNLNSCCKLGNNVASIILRNIGCTFPKNKEMNLD